MSQFRVKVSQTHHNLLILRSPHEKVCTGPDSEHFPFVQQGLPSITSLGWPIRVRFCCVVIVREMLLSVILLRGN